MKKIFLISHGTFAEGLKMSTEMICGKQENLISKCMLPGEHPSIYINEIEKELLTEGTNIILADLFGGSMCNEAMKLLKYDNTYLASGMNLPLVAEVLFSKVNSDEDFERIIEGTREIQKNVKVVTTEVEEDDFLGEYND